MVLVYRHYLQVENLIGFFVNTLVLRKQVNTEANIIDYIHQTNDEVSEAQLYQDLPFERLVEEIGADKDISRHPIFQVAFGVQHFGTEYEKLFVPLQIKGINQTSKFDLTCIIDDGLERLSIALEYATSLFEEHTIKGYFETYQVILDQLSQITNQENFNKQIKDIYYISQSAYQKIVIDYNKTDKALLQNKTIHQLFEEQAKRVPDKIAIVYEKTKITYKELNQKSNQLAHYLRKNHKIKPGDLVALFFDRSQQIIIAILAVLKSGGAYVPIDPSYPNTRITYILNNANAKILLTNAAYKDRLISMPFLQNQVAENYIIFIDNKNFIQNLLQQKSTNLLPFATSDDLAYVIYTSGTTGKPKGVLQQHNNVVHLFNATTNYHFASDDVWTLFHSYVFDFSIWEMWGALAYGGKLVIPSDEQITDITLFYNLCYQEKVTILNQTPQVFYQFINIAIEQVKNKKLSKLKYIIFGGDSLNTENLEKWVAVYGYNQPKLINMYGITEATIHVTSKEIVNLVNDFSIGKPIKNKIVYILDKSLNPLPVNAIGELYIGGVGLARGYLNQLELEKYQFISNPFQTEKEKRQNKNTRLYKTGDLVKMLPAGTLEYIGRNDFQVKVRGYRIELGEIESVITNYPGIRQIRVLALERKDNLGGIIEGSKYLVGYYVGELDIKSADTSSYINNWKYLYDKSYAKLSITNYKENFTGWKSSFTDKTIPKKEMLEWRDSTLNRINSLDPSVILEIGSGSGLLLFNLADRCKHYYATDFSNAVVKYTQKVINRFDYKNKVTVIQCQANNLPTKLLNENYDTVILNSVVQYFPTLEYLDEVLNNAINNMKQSGQIFIGDIRDYRLLDCFYFSILQFKNNEPNFVSIDKVDYFKLRDKELLISPEYFIGLQKINCNIVNVELLPKLGVATHEMNYYRYDVILHINKIKSSKQENIKTIDAGSFVKVLDISAHIRHCNEDYLYIKYPNIRIAKNYIDCCILYNETPNLSIQQVQNCLNIDELSKIFAKSKYKVKFFLDVLNPLYIDIVGYRNTKNNVNDFIIEHSKINDGNLNVSNNPIYNIKRLENQFANELKKYVETKLPDYMIPSYFVALEKLPLTINGKLDIKALPDPEFTVSNDYVPPKTEMERKICDIVADVLGIVSNKISINDDFFKIGGNSILAIKLVNKIKNILDFQFKASDIFVNKTVRKLAKLASKQGASFNAGADLNDTISGKHIEFTMACTDIVRT